jgi:hypothetical protein
MPNERLRALLLERGETPVKLAEAIQVDAKTVERWITKGRTPTGRAGTLSRRSSVLTTDTCGPTPWAVPRDTLGRLFGQTEQEIGVLVYSGMFIAEDAGLHKLFAERARAGARVRLLFGDPDSPNVAERGATEGIDAGLAAKVRNAIVLFRPYLAESGVEMRLHSTVLYNSIYRADDQLLINTHIYGVMANNAPVFHLRKIPGGEMASTYLDSFERIWDLATPYESR